MTKYINRQRVGFTIVELLVVIVVVAILASITVVSYRGIQKRAQESVLRSDLRQSQSALALAKLESGTYPEDASGLASSEGVDYEYTLSGDGYCLTARSGGSSLVLPHHISNKGVVAAGPCQGHSYGGPAPAGVNLVAPLSQWTLTGGATYDAQSDEIVFPAYGRATSPPVRIDGPAGWQVSVDIYSPPKPGDSEGRGQRLFGTHYFDANHQPFTVPGGWTSNGNAGLIDAGSWQRSVFSSGSSNVSPGLIYMQYRIEVSSLYGVLNTRVRNPEMTVSR